MLVRKDRSRNLKKNKFSHNEIGSFSPDFLFPNMLLQIQNYKRNEGFRFLMSAHFSVKNLVCSRVFQRIRITDYTFNLQYVLFEVEIRWPVR